MQKSHGEAVTSVLALAVVAILLSLLAAAIASSVNERPFNNDSQAAASEAASSDTTTDTTISAELKPGVTVCPGPAGSSVSKPVYYACVQSGTDDTKLLEQTCSAGFDYIVKESKGKVTVTPKAREPRPASCTPPASPPSCGERGSLLESIDSGPGRVSYFLSAGISEGNTKEAEIAGACGSPTMKLSDIRPAAIGKLLTDLKPEELKPALNDLGVSPGSSVLDQAFKSAEAQKNAIIKDNQETINRIKGYINNCASTSCDPSEVTDLRNEQARLEQYNAGFTERMAALAAEAKKIGPNVPNPPSRPDPGPSVPPSGPSTTVPPPSGPSTGFGPPTAQQQGANPLSSLLQQLLGGQQGQPPPGNQTPQQAGTCQQTTVCSNSSVYSRNTQCIDTKVEACDFGCAKDGKSCAPKSDSKKCTNEPQKPSAAKCKDGSWEPRRNSKDCITGWKCIVDGVTPTAQISCQPQVADVGMTVAVTYGCSTGVSEGDGFDTGGGRSGSATVTLSDPAAGNNKVFFGVTCTEKGVSDFQTCEVQVGRPGIVLVANPQSVEAGATTQIGWTTSGMESCIVSSLQQPDFTARNMDVTTVSGTAETDPISGPVDVVLTCTTLGGQIREASTTITIDNNSIEGE